MATPRVLCFDAEGRPLEFSVWLLHARRLLESQVQARETLWAHASGDLPEPTGPAPLAADPTPADTDRNARERADVTAWKSRDAAACIALSSLLPESEETHFTQVRTASEFLTAIKAPTALLALLPPPMAITIYFIATSLPDRLASVRDALLLKHPNELTIEVLESALKDVESNLRSVACASGAVPPPLFHGCTVPQLPTFTASLATATTDVTAAAVTTSSRSRGRSGRRGGQGAGGGGGGGEGDVASSGGGSAEAGGAPRAAAGDSPAAAGGGDARVPIAAAAATSPPLTVATAAAAAAAGFGQGSRERQLQRGVVHPPCTYHVLTGARHGQPCGRSHPPGQCFAQLTDTVRLAYGVDGPAPDWLPLVQTCGPALWGMSASLLVDLLRTPHAMYAVVDSSASDSVYSSVVSLGASLAEVPVASVGTCVDTSPGAAQEDTSLSFTLDFGASHCFFRDRATLTPLPTPVSVALADPTSGPVTARYTTTLPCPAVPSGSLTGFHVPSFSRNLVGVRPLVSQHVGVWIEPSGETAGSSSSSNSHSPDPCHRPLSVAASCSCQSLAHPTVLWHHQMGHPSISRTRAMSSQHLVLGLPRVLPSLPPSLAPPCGPCVEGWLRATPHSSSLRPATKPFETLHLDVWGPASCPGPGRESFFLVVVDEYSRYTTVSPLAKKSDVTSTLIRWLLTAVDTRGRCVSCPHSDRGAEPLATCLSAMVSPTSLWTGFPRAAWCFRVWGCLALVRDTSTEKISPRTVPSVFLGFPEDSSNYTFYHPPLHRFFNSRDIRFDESVLYYVRYPYRLLPVPPPPLFLTSAPPPTPPVQPPPSGPAPSGVSHATPPPSVAPKVQPPSLQSSSQPTADPPRAGFRGEDPGGASSRGAGVGAESVHARGPGSGGAGVGAELVTAGDSSLRGAGVSGFVPGGATTGGAPFAGPGEPGMDHVTYGGAGSGGGATGSLESGAAGFGARGERVGAASAGPTAAGGAAPAAARVGVAAAAAAAAGGAAVAAAAGAAAATTSSSCLWSSDPRSPLSFSSLPLLSSRLCPPRSFPSVLPSPPESALTASLSTPVTDYYRTYRPVISRVLDSLVTDPRASLSSVSALTAAITEFASTHCLDYATSLVAAPPTSPLAVRGESALGCDALVDRQFELDFLAAASPYLSPMLLAPEALDIPTPRTYAEIVSGPWASHWRAAMDLEMASYGSTGTYVDEVPPPGANVVDGMWIFRAKQPPGSPPVFKARYVARGFSQREGVDFFHTFVPTPKMTTLRVLLHVATQRDYELHSLDFSTAFLQGSLHEEVWLRHPSAFTGTFPPWTQWRLRRPVYSLRQAPREWHDTLRSTLYDLGFQPSSADPSLFVLQRFELQHSTVQRTSLAVDHRLTGPFLDEPFEPSGPYAELVGCLMYLMTCTHSELEFPLNILSRFVVPGRHRPVHWTTAVRVAKYIAMTSGVGLVFGGRHDVVLSGHCDSSYADDAETHRSTQGYCFSLGSGAVSWRSTCSSSVSTSTTEAKIYARAMGA
ncbi:unnamed protein product [Closterium sp. NIES-53]